MKPLFRLVTVASLFMMLGTTHGMALQSTRIPVSGSAAVATAAATLKELTRANIETFLASIDTAIEARDVSAIEAVLAPDLKVFVTNVPSADGPQKIEMSRDEYVKSMKENFAVAEAYKYSRSKLAIEILDGGQKAIVKDMVTEDVTVQGQKIHSVTNETTTIELRDGKPLLTIAEGDIVEMK